MNNKIIFVNSFKGGAGKTTVSLMHCISSLFGDNPPGCYENVIYMDLDILGTATSYLFEEGRLPRESCFQKTGRTVKIGLALEDRKEDVRYLHVAYLDPGFKNMDFSGEEGHIHHRALDEDLLKHKAFDFIGESMKMGSSTLIVLDCAPGFSELEQDLLKKCYQNTGAWDMEIEEDYVMTLDGAHIRKSVTCIKSTEEAFEVRPDRRSIHLVLIDLQDYGRQVKVLDGVDAAEKWAEMAGKIREKLGRMEADIYCCKYSKNIALKNTYLREEKVENQADDYLMTEENYRLLG